MWKRVEINRQVVYQFFDGIHWIDYPDGIGVPEIIIQELKIQAENKNPEQSLFTVKPANVFLEEAQKRPIPKKLFSEFWYEGELSILFADTNVGKSILAVQIGNSVASGTSISGFSMSAQEQKVLYYDFELSDKQFQNRYSLNYTINFEFSRNFYRAEINSDTDIPSRFKTFEEFLYYSLERDIIETESKVLIIDNITYLKTDTERAKDALPLMKFLKSLKNKYGLSILALAHTPKRDSTRPITVNDLQGSKMLSNFCDSIIAIGKSSKGENLRYIKQIKERATEKIYGEDHVIICEITKPNNFLHFEFKEYDEEKEHLKQLTEDERSLREFRSREFFDEGKSNVEIAKHFGVSEGAVRKWKKKYQDSESISDEIVPNVPFVPSTISTNGTIYPKEDINSMKDGNILVKSDNIGSLTDAEIDELFKNNIKVHRIEVIKYLNERRNILGSPAINAIEKSIENKLIFQGENGYLYSSNHNMQPH